MSTELATLDTGLVGDRQAIAVTVDRIKAMMPIPDKATDQSVWGLAQVCVALDLNPLAGEAYLARFDGKYVPIVGTMGYEKKAREQSEFHYDFEELDDVAMKKHRGEMYDPEDYGVRITLYHYVQARTCKELSIPYKPTITYGFWRKKASQEKKWNDSQRTYVATGNWLPDNVPSSWTKVMVAEKRAVRNAIKRAFSMTKFDAAAKGLGAGQGDEFSSKVYEVIEGEYQREQARTSPIVDTTPTHEEDDVLFATAPPEPLADVESLDDIEELPFDQPEAGVEEEEAIAEDPMTPYFNLWLNPKWELADHDSPTFLTLRDADEKGKAATPKGYGMMVGRMKQHGIGDDLRPYVLAVLFGRTITKDVRPKSAAAKSLHDWLAPEDEGGDAQVIHLVSEEIPAAIEALAPVDDDIWKIEE